MKPPFKDYSLGSKFASHYLCLVFNKYNDGGDDDDDDDADGDGDVIVSSMSMSRCFIAPITAPSRPCFVSPHRPCYPS